MHAYANQTHADEVTDRLRACCTSFAFVRHLSDAQLAKRIRDDRIDLLIDLSGHSADHRLPVFAFRPAPLQLTWLGYPMTTGAPPEVIDFRICDALADPLGSEAHGSEALLRLTSAWCFSPERVEAFAPGTSRPLTFGCFNNSAKLSPACIELFASVLQAMPESRLQLKAFGFADALTRERVVARFVEQGVPASRLGVLPPDAEIGSHLRRYRDIDIALDTWPYHGTTTTCEALSMGVPVLTLAGSRHASRVGVSLLTQLGTTDWIAHDRSEFVAKALRLSDPASLAAARKGLAERFRAVLCDGPRFAAEFGASLRQCWVDRCIRAAQNPNRSPA